MYEDFPSRNKYISNILYLFLVIMKGKYEFGARPKQSSPIIKTSVCCKKCHISMTKDITNRRCQCTHTNKIGNKGENTGSPTLFVASHPIGNSEYGIHQPRTRFLLRSREEVSTFGWVQSREMSNKTLSTSLEEKFHPRETNSGLKAIPYKQVKTLVSKKDEMQIRG